MGQVAVSSQYTQQGQATEQAIHRLRLSALTRQVWTPKYTAGMTYGYMAENWPRKVLGPGTLVTPTTSHGRKRQVRASGYTRSRTMSGPRETHQGSFTPRD